jgi:hypothetical protein
MSYAPAPVIPDAPLPDAERAAAYPGDLDALGERIAELSAQIEAASYQLLCLIRDFDAAGGWARAGARSCAHWLSWRVGLGLNAAREKVRVARALANLPQLSSALAHGEISFSKVRAVTRVATADNEGALLCFARHGTAAQVEKIVRSYRGVLAAQDAETEEHRQACRGLELWTDEAGMVVVRGRLTAEQGALLRQALERAEARLAPRAPEGTAQAGTADVTAVTSDSGEDRAAQRRADALALVAESALSHELERGTDADLVQVVLHVDAEALADPRAPGQCRFEGGGEVSPQTARRLSCDASLVTLHHAPDSSVLDVGRKRRTIPPAIRRALRARDSGCRFPGCSNTRHLHGHHLEHWADGGETRVDNLIQLCSAHHRLVHEGGFRVQRKADGELSFLRPDGQGLPAIPATAAVDDGVAALRERQAGLGLQLDENALTVWRGEPLDYDWAVDGLLRSCPSAPGP